MAKDSKKDPPQLNAEFVARALGLLGPRSTSTAYPSKNVFAEISTDSRTVKAKHLFVALKGANLDGNDFVEEAVKKGALGVICERVPPSLEKKSAAAIFKVPNAEKALRTVAAAWRATLTIPIVAIAGSVGKTTTKDLVAAALQGKFPRTFKTKGSENGFIGIPKNLLAIKQTHQAAVIEIGIDTVGAMAQHIDLVRPAVAAVTAIAAEHLEFLKNIETVAAEELKALDGTVVAGGIAVINLDDELIKLKYPGYKAEQKIAYSLANFIKPRPDVLQGRLALDGASIEVFGESRGLKLSREKFELPLFGKHNAANLMTAICVSRALDATPDEIRKGLKHFVSSGGRSQIEALPNGAMVICDYYNASPASMAAAMDLLAERVRVGKRKGTTWVCLGDMLELGETEEALHRKLAEKLAAATVGYAYLYGDRMKWLADELKRRRFDISVEHFQTQEDLAIRLKEWLRPDDAVLIKGSRGMQMEKVWDSLRGSFNSSKS